MTAPTGILANAHSTLSVHSVSCGLSHIQATIDGEATPRTYTYADGWTFTPDPEPLPTTPGLYVNPAGLPFRLDTRGWRLVSYEGSLSRTISPDIVAVYAPLRPAIITAKDPHA